MSRERDTPVRWPRQLTLTVVSEDQQPMIQLGGDYWRTWTEYDLELSKLEQTIKKGLAWLERAFPLANACDQDAAGELAPGTCLFYLTSADRMDEGGGTDGAW